MDVTPGTLARTVPPAVIVLDFDPLLRAGDVSVRVATLVLAAVIAGAILLAARIASRTPARGVDVGGFAHTPRLRLDDLLFIVLGTVPGAVIGGRIDYVVNHLDFYLAHPGLALDPAQGSLGLGLAVVGGVASGVIVTRLLEAPVGRWAHVAALPVLLVVAGGRASQVLSGDGQGSPTDLGWATSYVGPGPWGSLAPAVPSHPAQAYEAILTAAALVVLSAVLAGGGFAKRDGRALAFAIGLWAIVRIAVAATWRDAPVLADLNVAQLIAIAIAIVSGAVLAVGRWPARLRAGMRLAAGEDGAGEPHWPDPETRPRF